MSFSLTAKPGCGTWFPKALSEQCPTYFDLMKRRAQFKGFSAVLEHASYATRGWVLAYACSTQYAFFSRWIQKSQTLAGLQLFIIFTCVWRADVSFSTCFYLRKFSSAKMPLEQLLSVLPLIKPRIFGTKECIKIKRFQDVQGSSRYSCINYRTFLRSHT